MAEGSVTPLNKNAEMRQFFDFMYGDQTGYVYAPRKHPTKVDAQNRPVFEKNHFSYPDQLDDLVKYCAMSAAEWEVYYGPALYSAPTGRKEDIKGTYVFWTEFDGEVPPTEALGNLPSPSLRVRSSEEGHEHFYWRLDYFEIDVDAIERANRGLTYQLGGDTSAWDANQVLRPVSTYNHKRQKPVLTLAKNDSRVGAAFFSTIPVPPVLVSDIDTERVPDALSVIATYKWDKEAFDFFRKTEIPVGSRSGAMMRLGYYCAEMRMTDEEAFSLLFNADERWGKFKGRSDRKRRLLDIINKARLKFPLTPTSVEPRFPVFAYKDFLAADIQVEWLIPDLLQRGGFLILVGPPGTGKTQLSLQWAIHIALGREFLGYHANCGAAKVMFFSMEMGHADLKYFVEQMDLGLTDEEKDILQENLIFVPTGHGISLDDSDQQREVADLIESHKPIGCFFDSLGLSTTDDLSNESAVKTIMDWNARTRAEHGVFTWFVHHNRKAQITNKKPNKLEDVYGSQYIVSNATTVVGLWPRADCIEVNALKVRLAPMFKQFLVTRIENINFKRQEIFLVDENEEEAAVAAVANSENHAPTGKEKSTQEDLDDDGKPRFSL